MKKRYIIKGHRLVEYHITDWRTPNTGRPDIAVLMPYYNGEPWLRSCLDALDANDEPHDVFIIDDGSTTPVTELLAARENTVVVRLCSNVGITHAMNLGVCEIAGNGYEFLARQDVDDVSYPARFRIQRRLSQKAGADLVISPWRCVDQNGRTLYSRSAVYSQADLLKRLPLHNPAAHSTFFVKVSALKRFGAYDNRLVSAEDYDLLFRFLGHGVVAMTDEVLLDYRAHAQSLTAIGIGSRSSSLGVRIRHFDPRAFCSYRGVVRAMLLMFVPRAVTLSIKRRIAGRSTH